MSAAACSGTIAGDANPGDAPVGVEPVVTPMVVADGPLAGGSLSELTCNRSMVDPGPAPLRLLSRTQYLNTVEELFGPVDGLDALLEPASESAELGLIQADIAQVTLENYQRTADWIADAVTGDPNRLDEFVPCADADRRACARDFIENFGALAYRAPLLDQADIDRHLALYDRGAAQTHEHGMQMLLQGMLQAPRFLYRVELGTSESVGPNAVKLSAHELATRLAYTLWDAPPDDALLAAAESGELSTRDGVLAQVPRMLEDDRGAGLVKRFIQSWTKLTSVEDLVKDPELFPEWESPQVRSALDAQASEFLDYIIDSEQGRLAPLLSSSTVFVNSNLAEYYDGASGSAFQATTRPTAAGLLTLPALMAHLAKADESSPIYRGQFVREALLCQQLPSPPANVPEPPEVSPNVSTRERLAQHEVDPACSGCHNLIDPIGFAFENYDAIGRYRDTDGGQPVDTSGEIIGTMTIDGTFNGVGELAQKLSESQEVKDCVARQWFRFMLSRFEQNMDACAMKDLSQAFLDSDASLNVLPAALITSDAFLYRRPTEDPQ